MDLVEGDGKFAVGIHWYNIEDTDEGRVDLDLSAISLASKIGWNASFGNQSIQFSGDVVDAKISEGGGVEMINISTDNDDIIMFKINGFRVPEEGINFSLVTVKPDDIIQFNK